MKTHFHLTALMGIAIILAGAATACQKDPLDQVNPQVENISEAGFSLKGTEKRSDDTYVLPWTVSKAGVVDSVLEELDELTLTPFNTFTLEAVPDSQDGFPGINARTDNDCIKLERKDQNRFAISYLTDGEATIRVWNGREDGKTNIVFKVKARKTIPVEGLLVRIDGKEDVLIKAVTAPGWQELYQTIRDNPFYTVPYLSGDKIQYVEGVSRFSYYTKEEVNPKKVEILHLVPENTTYRRLNFSEANGSQISEMFCAGEYKWFSEARDGNSYKIPNGTQVSFMEGLSLRGLLQDVNRELKQKVLVQTDGFSCSSLKPAGIKAIIQAHTRLQTQ